MVFHCQYALLCTDDDNLVQYSQLSSATVLLLENEVRSGFFFPCCQSLDGARAILRVELVMSIVAVMHCATRMTGRYSLPVQR